MAVFTQINDTQLAEFMADYAGIISHELGQLRVIDLRKNGHSRAPQLPW